MCSDRKMAHSIEFSLFAPYNSKAMLIGSFADWKEQPMKKGNDGYFCTHVELEDGTYEYKFRVQSKSYFMEPDTWVDAIDPCATDINEVAQNSIVRIKDGKRIVDTYVWQHDDQPLPQNDEIVIYELLVRDFSGGEDDSYPRGQFQHVVEKLDYLQELGINAIELLPVQECPGEEGWGYNLRHYFAVESGYGSSQDLKHLIDECHARGIRVILDMLFNHSEAECPLTQIDYDYWYRREAKDPNFNWGPEFDYHHYDDHLNIVPAREYALQVIRYWISEYHVDGFRYDAVKQIDDHDLMRRLANAAQKTAQMKPFYNIGERIPESPEITNPDGPLDGCWHDSFCHTLTNYLCGDEFDLNQLKDAIDGKRTGYLGTVNVINYITNHDHDHFMAQLAEREIFGQSAFKRAKLGAALLMTAMGVPMIWMGEEFGAYRQKSLETSKIDWTLLNNDRNRDLFEYYRGLISLRTTNHALRSNHIEFFYEDAAAKVFAFVRWNDEGSQVVVVVNFSDQYLADYTITNVPQDGQWHEWTRDYDVDIYDGNWVTDLPEYEAQVLVWG